MFEEELNVMQSMLKRMLNGDDELRVKSYQEVLKIIHRIKEKYNSLDLLSDDVSVRILRITTENKELKEELAFLKIAAADYMEEFEYTVECMKKAVQYYKKKQSFDDVKGEDNENN